MHRCKLISLFGYLLHDLVLYVALGVFAYGFKRPQLLLGGGFQDIGGVIVEFVNEEY